MKGAFYLFFISFLCHSLVAQHDPLKKQATLWNRLHVVKSVGNVSSMGLLIENRQYVDPWRGHMFLAELNYKKKIGRRTKLGGHFTYLTFTLPHDPQEKDTWRKDEIRFHQSLTTNWLHRDKHRFFTRLMLEERLFKSFRENETLDGYDFGYLRLRTRLSYGIRINDRLEWIVSDEFMFQTPSEIKIRFDQNRLDTYFRYRLTPNIAIDLGYLNWYQETSSSRYLRHSIRTGVFINF